MREVICLIDMCNQKSQRIFKNQQRAAGGGRYFIIFYLNFSPLTEINLTFLIFNK